MIITSNFYGGIHLLKFLRHSIPFRPFTLSAIRKDSDLSDLSDLFDDARTDLPDRVNQLYQTAVTNTPAAISQVNSGNILCQTDECNPAAHNERHHAMFYTVPKKSASCYFTRGLSEDFATLSKAFGKTSLMVRDPVIEIMNYMRHAQYQLPVIRYILFGREGSGKSSSLAHLMHFCGSQDWIVMHLPWASQWTKYQYGDVELSTFKTGRIDQPSAATDWLNYFWSMNSETITRLNIVTENKYVWNRRESTEVGVPLGEAVEFGMNRAKYASDVVGLIVKEIKLHSSKGLCKTLVTVDGVNAFWQMSTIKKEEDRSKKHHAGELTLVHNFKKLLRNDWTGGAVVCAVDPAANNDDSGMTSSYMPRYVLGKDGFQAFDPHIPVYVPHYSSKEVHSCLDYYTANNWLQNPAGSTAKGRKEMIFLSGYNPSELYKVSQMW